jgi:hypothetical protein
VSNYKVSVSIQNLLSVSQNHLDTVAAPILASTLNWRRTTKKRANHKFKKLSDASIFAT